VRQTCTQPLTASSTLLALPHQLLSTYLLSASCCLAQVARQLAVQGCKAATSSAPFRGAVALSALARLLQSARASGLLSEGCSDAQTTAPQQDSAVSRAASELGQQLGGSGLATQLPAILAKAEQEVRALQAAAAKLQMAGPGSSTLLESNSSSYTSRPTVWFCSSDASTQHSAGLLQCPLLKYAADLLDVTTIMQIIDMPAMFARERLGCLEPAGRLAAATLQCLSTCLDKLPAQPATAADTVAARSVSNAGNRPSNCSAIAGSCLTGASLAADHVLQSDAQAAAVDPEVLEFLFTAALPVLHSAGTSSRPAQRGSSSGGSSSQLSSQTASCMGQDPSAGAVSTSLACSQCCQMLLSRLGYSQEAVKGLPSAGMLSTCRDVIHMFTQHIQSMSAAAALVPASDRHQASLLLPPPLLLAWAASQQHAASQHTPAGSADDPMQMAVSCSAAALQHWALLQHHQHGAAGQGAPQVPAHIAGPLLRELLPQVLDMLSGAVLAPTGTAAVPPSGSPERSAVHDTAAAACGLISWLLQHTPTTAQHSMSAAGAADQGAALLAAAAWRKHAPRPSTALEALVRAGSCSSLNVILGSSTWGEGVSAQTACRRQGSCLPLLLDAAVAAKSADAQLQHCSLLASLLKHTSAALTASSAVYVPTPAAPTTDRTDSSSSHGGQIQQAVQDLIAVTRAVTAALQADWQQESPAGVRSSTAGSATGADSSSSSSGPGGSSAAEVASTSQTAASCIMQQWQCALAGRCCMVLAQHLPRLIGHTMFGGGSSFERVDGNCCSSSSAGRGSPDSSSTSCTSSSCDAPSSVVLTEVTALLMAFRDWVARQDGRRQLPSPAGFEASELEAAADTVILCCAAQCVSADVSLIQAALCAAQLAGPLAVFGEALGAVPTPLLCNNPSCSNPAGPSELQLVSVGKNKICGKCQTSRYCCVDCQSVSWRFHRRVCRRLAAAK
jgi:hypothetical protein